MKNIRLQTILAPALALMALGCSSPTAMQSSEYDDMYYSASDKTEYVKPSATTAGQADAASAGIAQSTEATTKEGISTENYSGDEYYDGRVYNPRDNWYRPNYSFVDPYWGSAYVPHHYSRFHRGFYDPFYDPFLYNPFYGDPFFYDPFLRRPYWGSGLTISIGYNYGWGGGWYNPYYASRWFPGNPYYHGYYGGGFYGSPWYYDRPLIIRQPVRVQYGPRDARGTVVTDRVNNEGRPSRRNTEAGDRQVIEREDAVRRTARPSRSGSNVVIPPVEGEKNALPSRPSRPNRNEYYTPDNNSEAGPSRQPVRVGQPQEQRQVRPMRESNSRTQEYTPRREYRQEQRQARPVESRPSYETPRRERSSPSRSYESRPNSTQPERSGGGRPSRGQ